MDTKSIIAQRYAKYRAMGTFSLLDADARANAVAVAKGESKRPTREPRRFVCMCVLVYMFACRCCRVSYIVCRIRHILTPHPSLSHPPPCPCAPVFPLLPSQPHHPLPAHQAYRPTSSV